MFSFRNLNQYQTTIGGIVLGLAYYLSTTGTKMPETKQDWWAFGVGCFLSIVGILLPNLKSPTAPPGVKSAAILVGAGLVALSLSACDPQDTQEFQADVSKFLDALQAKKAEIIPRIQAGIAYAQAVGDEEWADCQTGILGVVQSPAPDVPDITNPWINLEVLRQINQGIKGANQQGIVSSTVRKINKACAPWYLREKLEVTAIIVKLGLLVAPTPK